MYSTVVIILRYDIVRNNLLGSGEEVKALKVSKTQTHRSIEPMYTPTVWWTPSMYSNSIVDSICNSAWWSSFVEIGFTGLQSRY